MLDRRRILAKLDEVERFLDDLEKVRPPSYDAYVKDLKARYACERIMQVTIEALGDVAELFVLGERLGLPTEEAGLSRRLVEGEILGNEDADLLRRMQGFRNVLVHRYGALDDPKVFRNLGRASDDVRRLVQLFRGVLDERRPS